MTSEQRTTNSEGGRASGLRQELLSVLRGTETGVTGAVVWFAAGEFDDSDRYLGPRLLVVLGDDIRSERLTSAVSVRLASPPYVVGVLPPDVARQVESFVGANRDVLLRHWDAEIDTRETLDRLERVRP